MKKITPTTPITEVQIIQIDQTEISYKNDYPYFYMPSHPLARLNGTVSAARHNASLKVGYWLHEDEVVRRLDSNPKNIAPSNLVVLTKSEAMGENALHHGNRVTKICEWCKGEFSVVESHVDRRHHCSPECAGMASRKFHATPEELKSWVWEIPLTQLGKMLGVSDNAVRKRCRKHGIPTPPRGYWALTRNGQTHSSALECLGLYEGDDGQIHELENVPLKEKSVLSGAPRGV